MPTDGRQSWRGAGSVDSSVRVRANERRARPPSIVARPRVLPVLLIPLRRRQLSPESASVRCSARVVSSVDQDPRKSVDQDPERAQSTSSPVPTKSGISLASPEKRQPTARMAGNGVPVLLITANVGSIFEEVRLTFARVTFGREARPIDRSRRRFRRFRADIARLLRRPTCPSSSSSSSSPV